MNAFRKAALDAQERHGWNDDELIDVLLAFLTMQGDETRFVRYMNAV